MTSTDPTPAPIDAREATLIDRWAEILTGLPGVEPEHFERLFRRALAMAVETLERFPDLLARVEDRLDEIWVEFRKSKEASDEQVTRG